MGKHSGVTWFAQRNCYAKKVGKRRFYFGQDERAAVLESAAIVHRWKELNSASIAETGSPLSDWPKGEPNRYALQARAGLVAPIGSASASPVALQTAPIAPAVRRVAVGGLTTEQAAKVYLGERKADNISERTWETVRNNLSKGIEVLGRERPIGDVGQSALVAFVAYFKVADNASQIYAKHVVQQVKALLCWASDHDQIQWEKPKRFDSIMLIQTVRPRNEKELEALKEKKLGPDRRFFRIDQLKALYSAACPVMRAWLLLGLNCAIYPDHIAGLKKSDFKRDGKRITTFDRIETLRSKTLVVSKHDLWPETTAAIMATMSDGHKHLFSRKGNGPITRTLIAQKYKKLRTIAKVEDAPGFKYLRHTSKNEIKKLSSEEISVVHAAQTPKEGIDAIYTAPNWEAHAAALVKLREVFKEVWS